MKKSLLLVAAFTALSVSAARAQAPQDLRTTIAVLPFEPGGMLPEYAPLSKGFQALLINSIASNGRIRVVERDQIQRILDEQKLGTAGQLDPATMVRVGKILGAKYMLKGMFLAMKRNKVDEMTMTIQAFDTETSEYVYTHTSKTVKAENLMELIAMEADTANARLKLPQLAANTPAAREAAAVNLKASKLPLAAAMLYARAEVAKDAGKPDEAKTLYKQVLDKFPDYQPAVQGLKDLKAP